MKVKDITSVMQPWQSLIVKKDADTQLDEPLFDNTIDIRLPDHCSPVADMEVVGLDASWNTIVILVK